MTKSLPGLLLVFLLFSTTWGTAQHLIGVFSGVNSSILAGDAPEKANYKSLIGLNAGVHFDLKLSKTLYLSMQPSYSQEGTKIFYNVGKNEEPVDSFRIRLNYFSLPLMLKVMTPNERFYALGGVETGLLSNYHVRSHDEEVDMDIDIETVNIVVHFGAGIKIPLGLPKLFIELRYTQGLLNLTDEPVLESYVPRVKTSGFKVLAGIEFPLKKSND
jgi:hypothetical protein